MKCLILAAGYATRLYPLTENFPKPLLTVGDRTILDWLIDDIDTLGSVEEDVVISNHKFAHHFDNLRKRSILANACRLAHKIARCIEGRATDRVPRRFLHGNTLPCQNRLVHRAMPLAHHAIHGNAVARSHRKEIALPHLVDGKLCLSAAA